MADIKYYDVILKPIVTEKSMNAMAEKRSSGKDVRRNKGCQSQHNELRRKDKKTWNDFWKDR